MGPYLSVVIPVYNEEPNLRELFARLQGVLDSCGESYELLFVDDGSHDRSAAILREFHAERPEHVRVIEFNANYGQHQAIIAAFERVRGEVVITLDADLQNPPEELPKLIDAVKQGHDVVGTYRRMRRDNFFRRWASRVINRVRERTTGIKMRDHGCMLRAYRREIIDHIVATREGATFIPALALNFAGNPTEIEVAHARRSAGSSKYRFYDLIRLNFDLMTGFSLVPLQIFTMLGMLVATFSGAFVFYLFIRRLVVGPEAQGVFTLFAILFFLVGMLILGLGIIGEYIGRIYLQVRNRPHFIIRAVYEQPEK